MNTAVGAAKRGSTCRCVDRHCSERVALRPWLQRVKCCSFDSLAWSEPVVPSKQSPEGSKCGPSHLAALSLVGRSRSYPGIMKTIQNFSRLSRTPSPYCPGNVSPILTARRDNGRNRGANRQAQDGARRTPELDKEITAAKARARRWPPTSRPLRRMPGFACGPPLMR
jgi:hypothetical protein